MRISCICPTYNRCPGRQWLLEESILCFLKQDYDDKELIILNDAPDQELRCDEDQVRIVNAVKRHATLGEKYNAAIQLSTGDVIAPWEDDDIILPWRLSMSLAHLGDCDYWNPKAYWFWDSRGLHADHAVGYAHACGVFTRESWRMVGGYPHVTGNQDALMDGLLHSHCDVAEPGKLDRSDWFYVYRWGVSHHLSGRYPHDDNYADIGRQPVAAGVFTLTPVWHRDYVAICQTGEAGDVRCCAP